MLRERAGHGQLTGILNGIDESYDPSHDPHLEHHFNARDFSGKENNATDVRAAFGLEEKTAPLFALVSRLVHQKGVDMVVEAAEVIVSEGGQVVVTGQGEPELERAIVGPAERHPEAVGVHIGFDETLARRMYAGSDFLLMPSRLEPCGLGQMYAQRFGTLPIAPNTGSLADTIQDNVTGFLFDKSSVSSLGKTIHRASGAYTGGHKLQTMKRAAMQRPAGWRDAARHYHALYRRAAKAG